MKKVKEIYCLLNSWKTWGGYAALHLHGRQYKKKVLDECKYWCDCLQISQRMSNFQMWNYLLITKKEYVNLAKYRLSTSILHKILAEIMFVFLKGESTLFLTTKKIGWNLFIQHGFSTVISAKSIGDNCWINQQVTIGWSFRGYPTIGNGVRITAGAKVIGDIYIGDNAIIGANAVVTKNVSENAIVVGIPAKCIGNNDEHKLYIK